ncbi:pyridoxal phosphate-dependent aminotransferase [Zunongwangia pacifica]|uniref:Histidinol-phosphate aminotransferase family protein n=1 Tax=Zunongwangia pacifica TaxID=2911062 RepID=A0A9X2CQ02_9FLAO|nr:histidinol-phosphate transaminase [Zunongwangia pacifica]MCL6220799.1 histidinol-phosphate aminotransferase family protein [Zunongwangia pacifica]
MSLNRREWLKRGALAMGAVAVAPSDLWAKSVAEAQSKNNKFLFNYSNSFDEYTPPKFPDLKNVKARLVWNENPHGPSKMAAEAFQKAVMEGNHYSWGSLGELVSQISEYEGVEPYNVMMGPGSSDLLEKTALVKFQHGGNVVSGDPSYMSLVSVAKAAGGNWKAVKLTDDYQHDLKAMEEAIDKDTKLVYITNPNNPTATMTDTENLKDFCKRVSKKVPVFIDEAYIELSPEGMNASMAPLVAEGYDIYVARTFSKIHGMAGLRVGYMLGNKKSLEEINDITRGGMGITGPSIAAASASMKDEAYLKNCKAKIEEARNYTITYLKSRGMDYMPSNTNFVIFPIAMDGDEFLEKIYEKKVVVRAFKFWDQDWCRVSMGTMKEMKYFTDAIDEILV